MRRTSSFVVLAGALACADSAPVTPVVAPSSAVAAARSAAPARYEIVKLPSPGGSGAGNSIDNKGFVAGSRSLATGEVHAALWRGRRLIDLKTLGGPNSLVPWPGQNEEGLVVGISETAQLDTLGQAWSCSAFFPSVTGHTCLGFAWRNGVMTPMPTLGGQNSFATAANDRGVVVGWAETAVHDPTCDAPQVLQFRAVAWRPATGQVRQLKPLPGDSTSAATGINRRNQVIGISGRCGVAVGMFSAQHAVIWENGSVRNLGDLGGTSWQTPMAINENGDIVGFSNPPGDSGGAFIAHAVYWPKGGAIRDLRLLPGDDFSEALGINIRGQIVGLSCGGNGCRALLWEQGRMIDLNTLVRPSGDLLYYAGDINDRGEITGVLIEGGTGEARAFVARPIG